MDKRKIELYKDGEAEKEIANYRDDWSNIVGGASMHKTGLKMLIEEDKASGNLYITNSNFAPWAKHMSKDEMLSGREIYMYRARLAQEFEVLLNHYIDEQMKEIRLTNEMMPYMISKSVKDSHKS